MRDSKGLIEKANLTEALREGKAPEASRTTDIVDEA